MPDWFYRTVSRPLLYRLRPVTARSLALGFMARLARFPLGPQVIDLLGHMRPDARLALPILGTHFDTPVGLGPRLDPQCVALEAFSRFGIGFADVGPVGVKPSSARLPVERDDPSESIVLPDATPPLDLPAARAAFARHGGLPLLVRVVGETACEYEHLIEELRPFAKLFATPVANVDVIPACVEAAAGTPILLLIRPEESIEPLESGLAAGASGVLIDGAVVGAGGETIVGGPARERSVALVKRIRERFGESVPVVAAGGVHEPEHALALFEAGANLVEIDSGLVFNGPGLVKRTNDAVLYRAAIGEAETAVALRPAAMTWFWMALMGAGMLLGGLLALGIAATRVVLPYDEAFLGMSREQIQAINPRLLSFMAHDRVSLVGPMLGLGAMYLGLSLGGIRRGLHWAMVAVLTSASIGFASFFLFLGFGYLDPLHAFVTACLFQFLLLAVHSELGTVKPDVPPQIREDRAWRLAQWGQLVFVVHAVAIAAAGVVISGAGITTVFVPEDLEFMQTTAEHLKAANPRLLPLIAHDRATFGGMLVCTGIVMLLTSLWGFRPASHWLWWTLLVVAAAGYLPAIGVHLAVGYTDGMHLLPAFVGLGVFLLGLALSRPHLCKPASTLVAEWKLRCGSPVS